MIPEASGSGLAAAVAAELWRAVPAPVAELAADLAGRAGPGCAAVLFYGSALRDDALDGVLDYYVLTDRPIAWPGSRLTALLGRWLPPNVGYTEADVAGQCLRAKYAVMTTVQFARAMSAERLDTTMWARFSQPAACVWARSDVDRANVAASVAAAVVTAAFWAAALGPVRGDALAFWRALYARTYEAELRVERQGRAVDLLAGASPRWRAMLTAAWREAHLAFAEGRDGTLGPRVAVAARASAERRWQRRQRLGRPLNVLRLLKAALTFDNAIDYAAWKVERHSGYRIEPSPFQRRHPLLAAPLLYLRLKRRGVLR